MPRLTAKFIETEVQCPEVGQLIIRDDELKGFGLRVTKRCMSFIVERKVNGKACRVTLGKYGLMTPEVAQREAQKFLSGAVVPQRNKMEGMCSCGACHQDQSAVSTCKAEARQISAVLTDTWVSHYISHSNPVEFIVWSCFGDRIGGYLCSQWVDFFANSLSAAAFGRDAYVGTGLHMHTTINTNPFRIGNEPSPVGKVYPLYGKPYDTFELTVIVQPTGDPQTTPQPIVSIYPGPPSVGE